MTEETGLQLRGVCRRIADFELQADFAVSRGERLALIGRSGCGKTSLLRVLAGLDPASSGRITLDGVDITSVPPESRGIGYVFQEHALFPSMTVLENAAFGLRMRGLSRQAREDEAMEWLRKVGMTGLARTSIEKLSGGERQRIAVVRALAWKPKLLLLDEPFSALDRETKGRLIGDLLRLLAERPVPVILVTHELGDVETIATRRIELQESEAGRIRRFGHSRA